MNDSSQQAYIFISGLVQNVGFRQFVRSNARKLGLVGWVKNTPDGRVEALAIGSKEKIQEFISMIKKGTYLSDIKNVVVEWQKVESTHRFTSFDIIHE